MSRLNVVQKIARLLGKKSTPNTWFNSDIMDKDNQSVWLSKHPLKIQIALGTVELRHLYRIIKTRLTWRLYDD